MRTALLLFILFFAQPALASVVITEIAWMGDAASADNEWIELHNTGTTPVSLEGWYGA